MVRISNKIKWVCAPTRLLSPASIDVAGSSTPEAVGCICKPKFLTIHLQYLLLLFLCLFSVLTYSNIFLVQLLSLLNPASILVVASAMQYCRYLEPELSPALEVSCSC